VLEKKIFPIILWKPSLSTNEDGKEKIIAKVIGWEF
jgi:hypothetical protein